MNSTTPRRLIIISNRLPFQLVKAGSSLVMKESDGGLVSALKSYFENIHGNENIFASTLWIGSAEFSQAQWDQFRKSNSVQANYSVEPIFIDKNNYNKYYNGFCNATVWPLFHYFPSFVEFDNQTFKAYEEVNQLFATRVVDALLPGDVVWVHDYQLMLLPGLIRKSKPQTSIGFFMHIPFPSFEVFRLLHRPWKDKLVDGLLGADLVGFHTHEYVQHFLKTVQMVKGYDHRFRTIFLPDRVVKAEMFPLGIDFKKFNDAIGADEVIARKKEIQESFGDKKIIFSVDRLDYTKGITHRLSGFERFLELHPEWRGNVIFILVVVPSRLIVSKYNERKKLIEEEIGRINGKYSTIGWQPIIYRYNYLSFHELVAMYDVAHVGLITPLRDGMNLVAKEYVASRRERGVLILSELAGAASELSEAILVNPMDKDEVSDAILVGLTMPAQLQKHKIEVLQRRLKEYTVMHWITDFIRQLDETKSLQQLQETKFLTNEATAEIKIKYASAKSRLLLLDYDGTLVPFSRHPLSAVPGEKINSLLSQLANDISTNVTIISGRDSDSLERWFGGLPITLISEHGASMKNRNGTWQHDPSIDQSWKVFIRPVLEVFTQRSPGSVIEDKMHTLVWHYRNVEAELGFIRSRELLDNLHHLTRNANLHILDGNKVIEARVSNVNKGAVTKRVLEEGDYDFVLAIGDDKTDEDMFQVLGEKGFTIKIGAGHTVAQYFLPNQEDVIFLLNQLVKASTVLSE